VAQRSEERQKHGAVLVKGGRLLATGINSEILDPYIYAPTAEKFSVHAEEAALARVKDAAGAVLYVARVNNQGEERLSKPCPGCQTLISDSRCKRVVWTV
jgi:deoxycytidylate deaminase